MRVSMCVTAAAVSDVSVNVEELTGLIDVDTRRAPYNVINVGRYIVEFVWEFVQFWLWINAAKLMWTNGSALSTKVKTRQLATANRSRVSNRDRPCKSFPHICSLITVQNLVVVSLTVCACRRSQNLEDAEDGDVAGPLTTSYSPICFLTKFRRCRSSRLGVCRYQKFSVTLWPRPLGCGRGWLSGLVACGAVYFEQLDRGSRRASAYVTTRASVGPGYVTTGSFRVVQWSRSRDLSACGRALAPRPSNCGP